MTARDMPRKAAPLLIGVGDIAIGWARAADPHTHSYSYSQVPGSLVTWGVAFVAVGVLVIAGAVNRAAAWGSLVAGLFLWLVWAQLLHDAHTVHPDRVPISGPVTAFVIAFWHCLLSPFRRQVRR